MPEAIFQLLTPRLVLRPLQATDLIAFTAYRADPDVARYQSWEPLSTAQAAAFLATYGEGVVPAAPGKWVQIGIADRTTDILLGDCALQLYAHEPRQAEIGISLARSAQGQGYAAEVLRGLLQYCFQDLRLHRIVAVTDCLNEPVNRLLEHVGMKREAHFRQNIWFKGAWGDEYVYAALGQEWLLTLK